MRVLPAALIVSCLLAVGGCADAPAHRGADRPPVPLRGTVSVPAPQAKALHEAEERAVASCMRDRGLTYRPVPMGRQPASENPYGLLSEHDAATDGYGITSNALAAPVKDLNASATSHWSAARQAAWQRALTGTGHHQRVLKAPGAVTLRVNTDGCVYRARRALYGPAWEQTELRLQGLSAKVITEVTRDRAFRGAQRAWASCMRDNGEDVGSLQQARGLIQDAANRAGASRAALRRVGDRELRLSGHDAACQRKTDLAAAVRTAQKRVEARLPASSWKVVTTVTELRGQALRKGKGRT